MPENPDNRAPDAASPLARALARQSAEQLSDLIRARGLGAETFERLARRADELVDDLGESEADPALIDLLRERRGVLRAVARLIADPAAPVVPPSNHEVYGAVLDITELHAIVSTLRPGAGIDRLLAHVTCEDPDAARRDRLLLAFGAVCRRGGLAVRPGPEAGSALELEIDRWPIAAAAAVPLREMELPDAAAEAEAALRGAGRPGLIVLEAGALLDWKPIRVADDHTAIAVMNERLDAFMIDRRDAIADATGTAHAFGLVVHATLPATNAASNRLMFAECLRAVNLCDAGDARIAGFQAFIHALSRAGTRAD
jgi:hypothetical protein